MDLLERVGSYAGLASFLGLAILALLYFSQARDVRRLRDWAGRAPERAGETAERSGAAAQLPAQHGLPPLSLAEHDSRPRKSLRERLRNVHLPRARWVAAALATAAVIGGGIYAALQLTDESNGGDTQRAGGRSAQRQPGQRTGGGSQTLNVDPAQVTVAVLNGTTVQGLASNVGEEVRGGGFTLGTIGNGARIDQERTAVLYRSGQAREARAVANRLGVKTTAPVDQVNEEIAGSFDVVVLVGADRGG